MTESWGELFDRGAEYDVSPASIGESLERRRADGEGASRDGTAADAGDERDGTAADAGDERDGTAADAGDERDDGRPNPARVVADADVLAADLLVGGAAREALDHARRHDWVELAASDPLLDDVEALVAAHADAELAAAHRARLEAERIRVDHPASDHPGLASAYRDGAGHVLSFDDGLTSTTANLSLKPRVDVSVRSPDAFARLFDPERLYGAVRDGEYSGPDRDPRA